MFDDFNFEVGDLVELTIDRGEQWESLSVTTTIVGIAKRPNYTEFYFPIVFDFYSDDDQLEGENGFMITRGGLVKTIQHSFNCIVEAKVKGGRRDC